MLKEFAFPILLALASTVAGVVGLYSSDYARRWLWSVTLLLWFLALLAFLWSDPVRGPFYRVTHAQPTDSFRVHGAATIVFPLKDLSHGIDITQRGIAIAGNPAKIWIRNNWLFGWQYKVAIKVDNQDYDILNGNHIGILPSGWDITSDDRAIEIVNENSLPVLQIVTDSDYDVYINLALIGDPMTLIINNTNPQGGRITQQPTT